MVHWKRGGSKILPAIVFEYRVQVCLARNGDVNAGLVNVVSKYVLLEMEM
jgi:hypothetical protein